MPLARLATGPFRGNIASQEDAAMPEPRTVTVYIDYKSPYAYLACDHGFID